MMKKGFDCKGQSLFLYLKSAHSQFNFVFRIRQLAEELQVSESLLFDDSLIIESILG
mgnify:CR=1 FL=1